VTGANVSHGYGILDRMRALPLLVLLLAVGCRSRVATERDSDFYVGAGVSGVPGVGGSVTAGQYFSKRRDLFDFAFEMRATYQGAVEDSATQDGKFAQVQAGVRQTLSPGHPQHFYFRYGFGWFRATGDPRVIDIPADYFGGYGAAGYEWRLGDRVWIGPEIAVNYMDGEGSIGAQWLPQAAFNIRFDF
jgi:hypothetical protein